MKVPGVAAPKQIILVSRPSPQTGAGASDGVVTVVRPEDLSLGNSEESYLA
jgi:hypothetical protein